MKIVKQSVHSIYLSALSTPKILTPDQGSQMERQVEKFTSLGL